MKQFFLEMLKARSSVSTLRVMSVTSLLSGILMGLYGLYKESDLMGLSALCAVFVGAAFGGKVSQKAIENKTKEPND